MHEARGQQVTFYSSGHRIAGVFRRPASYREGRRYPAVVICHGLGSVKEMHPPPIADGLNSNGFATLAFDYRGFGESEGRRWLLKPMDQVEDAMNAVTLVAERPEVDRWRIGLFGASFGGAVGVVAGALDPRIKALVISVAMGDCSRWLRGQRSSRQWRVFLESVEANRRKSACTGQTDYIETSALMNVDSGWTKAVNLEARLRDYPTWSTKICMDSVEWILRFKPEDYLPKIAPRGVLFIGAKKDTVVPPGETRTMYRKSKRPKELFMFEGAHYDVYSPPLLSHVTNRSVDWYEKHLKA